MSQWNAVSMVCFVFKTEAYFWIWGHKTQISSMRTLLAAPAGVYAAPDLENAPSVKALARKFHFNLLPKIEG